MENFSYLFLKSKNMKNKKKKGLYFINNIYYEYYINILWMESIILFNIYYAYIIN